MSISRYSVARLTGAVLLTAISLSAGKLPAAEVHQVSETCDRQPFSYRVDAARDSDAFRLYRLTYPSPVTTSLAQNNTITAELYLPKGIGKDSKPRPAVVCLHILGGGYELTQLQCSTLARRGIPAIWFKLPYYVISDKPRDTIGVYCTPKEVTVLQPREQHPRLPHVPEDTVLISGDH
jgi:hypothetical protein